MDSGKQCPVPIFVFGKLDKIEGQFQSVKQMAPSTRLNIISISMKQRKWP